MLAEFDRVGVTGAFCITGEKCRSLMSRGRQDVLAALSKHSLGLHTDTHSFHPTTMEMLAHCTFDDGCVLAIESESPGYRSFMGAFQRPPVFWGGAGNTWSPEITEALKHLGIRAYSYALTSLPDNAVHEFNGVMSLPQALSISEDDWMDADRARLRSDAVLQSITASEQPWIGVFVGHPTRFRHCSFWDAPYAGGRTPQHPEFAALTEESRYRLGLAKLGEFLCRLADMADIVAIESVLELPWISTSPSRSELEHFEVTTSQNLRDAARWPIHPPDLDVTQIVEKAMMLSNTLRRLTLLRRCSESTQ